MKSKIRNLFVKDKTEHKKTDRKIIQILVLMLIVFALGFIFNNNYTEGTEIAQRIGNYDYRETGWVLKQGDKVIEENVQLPYFKNLETGQRYSISTILTYDGQKDHDPTCFYFVDHMYTNAYLNGEKIFSYSPEDIVKKDKSKSPGNIYTYVQLPKDCQGQEFTIEVIPALSGQIEYQLTNPIFGDYSTIMKEIFMAGLPHNIIVSVLFMFGMISVIFATFSLEGSKYREGVYLGIFAILVSIYNMTESDFDFYVILNPYYTYLIDYISFSLIPISLMAFLRERFEGIRKNCVTTMIFVGFAIFGIELFLHFNGIMDMREILPLLHIQYLLDFIVIFLLIVSMKKNHWKRSLSLQLLPLILGAIADGTIYYQHWQLGTSDSTFISLSVIVLLSIEFFNVMKYSKQIYSKSIRSEEYEQMAYIDPLTGIGNRRAYEVEKENIVENSATEESVIIISADINKLKDINDNYGHSAGDFVIRSAATVLAELPGKEGNAFRIGGDEFVILIYNITLDELQIRLYMMQKQIDKINEDSNVKLSLAVGYELYDAGKDFTSQLKSADQKMYVNKSMQHSALI